MMKALSDAQITINERKLTMEGKKEFIKSVCFFFILHGARILVFVLMALNAFKLEWMIAIRMLAVYIILGFVCHQISNRLFDCIPDKYGEK